MANPVGGQLGTRIWNERESGSSAAAKTEWVGSVGNPNDMNNAQGLEIRGSSWFDADGGGYDWDFYQGTASWWRDAAGASWDQTPISGSVDISVLLSGNQIAIVSAGIFDPWTNTVAIGIDIVFTDEARAFFGEEVFQQFEAIDQDFVTSPNQAGERVSLDWKYDQIVGDFGNTYAVGIGGTMMDIGRIMNSDDVSDVPLYSSLDYTINWSFG